MRCERCGSDEPVERYDVGEFTGYLCQDCREIWDELVANGV